MNSNGGFTYIPDTDFTGNDSFTYNAIADEGTVDEEISNTATVYLVVYAPPVYGCINDVDGANDEPGQGDMTKMCIDLSPANPDTYGISWNWDNTEGSGANTYFACALFDNNGNGMVDYSMCVQLLPDATNNLTYVETEYYTCSDAKPDRCVQPSDPINMEYCSTEIFNDDPFDATALNGPGDNYPDDYKATCAIPNTLVGGAASTLVNVCAYTSVANPNSDPKDCIVSADAAYAFLSIVKTTNPPTSGLDFGFTISPATLYGTTTPTVTTNGSGIGASNTFLVDAGTYSVTETSMPPMWALDSVSCTGQTSGDNTSLGISSYDNVVCTFNNSASLVDISVTKWDYDYTRDTYGYPKYPYRGSLLPYTFTVTNKDLTIDNLAQNVIFTDTLDANVTYDGTVPFSITPATDYYGVARSCAYDSIENEVTCNLGTMDILEDVTITFAVRVGPLAPIGSGIEFGECTQNPNQQYDPIMAMYYPVDVCNIVSVTADNEAASLLGDNTDSEPTDLGKPTAITLLSFTATGEAGAIRLDWETGSETQNLGFNIYRAVSLHAPKTQINEQLIPAHTGSTGEAYFYIDEVNGRNTFYYWIEDVDIYNNTVLHEDMVVSARALKKIK
jgi:uncharacterized repeat protein (TIGR01451 family)